MAIAQNSPNAYSDYSVSEADADLSWSQTVSAATHTLSLTIPPADRDAIQIIHHGETESTEMCKN